jgi:outer membrane protein TolC
VFGPAQVAVGNKDRFHWDIAVTQPLFTGYALTTKRKIAELGVDIEGLEKAQAVLDVTERVKVAYYNILLAKKFLLVADESVAQLSAHVKDAEKFYDQGMIPYNDLLKSKVALANARQNRQKAASKVNMAISSFNVLLGLDINTTTKVEDVVEITRKTFDLDTLLADAMSYRPELQVLRLKLKDADFAKTLARSSYYPQVALVGTYERNGHDPAGVNNDYGNPYNASFTLQVKWNLFEWGRKKAEVSRARHRKMSLAEKIEGIEESIKLEVKNALLNIQVADANIRTAEESLNQAKENFRIASIQYQNQTATSTDVLDARAFLTQAETNYFGALYGYMISLAELDRAVGKSTGDNK